MATLVLQAAGAALGGILGPVGAAIGGAAGSMAGYLLDRALINSTLHHKGPRLKAMQPFTAEEGAAIPRVYGTMRIGGTVIWATRFEERSTSRRSGVKGGPKTTTFSYFANMALALCEGPIAGVRRIWVDGKEIDRTRVEIRIFDGYEGQLPDDLIVAKQGAGNVPAYRGVGYAVIDHLPIEEYGNRLPQLQFEVLKPVGDFGARVKAVTLIPGATEQGLATSLVTRGGGRGVTDIINRHVLHGPTDLDASLDELAMLCPNLESVALVVAWFGDDLRAGQCSVRPAVMDNLASGQASAGWMVSGVDAASARQVSRHLGAPAYGGTPSDASVIEAIAAIKARGWKVTVYPFVMMDVPHGNDLPDPYGAAEQAAYPWRGKITCDPAPMGAGTADVTAAARAQVDAFCGVATPVQFLASGNGVAFSGDPDDWGYRRMVLHYARLAQAAGGVDAFLVGSELRGLTTLRDDNNAFPFVEQLTVLAADVRAMLGPATKLTYGADWSEYFGHHPQDGSGDVFFHLDPLWASPAIDAVGIDCYMPLSDWRDEDFDGGNPDGFRSPYDKAALRAGIHSGEGFDWFYASAADRSARLRTPITDGTAQKPWVFRYKDLQAWWENAHFDRVGGVEASSPTAWTPRSKPIWLTELGCAAVDKGPNQPNVFPDPKSADNAVPYFSDGGRSDLAQTRLLEAHFDHWGDAGTNPVSPAYGEAMVDLERIYVWTWDARPFPAFPLNGDLWADGGNWRHGHWLNGRLGGLELGSLAKAILADHGIDDVDTGHADGWLHGFAILEPGSARDALSPLVELFDLAVFERAGQLRIATEADSGSAIEIDDPVAADGAAAALEAVREPDQQLPTEVSIACLDPMAEFRPAVARAVDGGSVAHVAARLDLPGAMETGQAEALATDWLRRARGGRETIRFAVDMADRRLLPGSVVTLPMRDNGDYLVTAVEDGLVRRVEARRIVRIAPTPDRANLSASIAGSAAGQAGKPLVMFLDLPAMGAEPPHERLRVAAFASPWRSQQVLAAPGPSGYGERALLVQPAVTGQLIAPAPAGFEGRVDHSGHIDVRLDDGELSSVALLQMFNGANAAALRAANGVWEVLQFAAAEEIEPSIWRLSDLLRGQLGTGDAAEAGAPEGSDFVLLNEAVRPAGLSASEIGLQLNWRVGPSGYDLSDQYFASAMLAGGLRASLPLSPVHLRAAKLADGSVSLNWIRRGRLDADSWLGTDIPLGEESERYSVSVALPGGPRVREVEIDAAEWTYPAAYLASDFPGDPPQIEFSVRQISASVGAGLPASLLVDRNP